VLVSVALATGSRTILGQFSDSTEKIGFDCRRNQFNPTLLDEQKNGDLKWTARYVVR